MRSPPAGIASQYASRASTLAEAIKVTRSDGTVYGWTSHDQDSAAISGVVYSARPGLDISRIQIGAGAAVGNLELTTLHDGSVFTANDVRSGKWRNAAFFIFRYNWANVADSVDNILAGNFGEVELRANVVVAELRDLRQYLQQPVVAVSSKNCRYRLGVNNGISSRCPVRLDPPAWVALTAYTVRVAGDAGTGSVVKHASVGNRHFKCTTAGTSGAGAPAWDTTIGNTTTDGTVVWTTIQALTVEGTLSSVTSNQVFRDNTRTEAADYFAEGTLTWLTGNNAGLAMKVKDYAADGTFTLVLPMLGAVQATDTYRVTAGCRKRHDRTSANPAGVSDCIDKFDAVLDFGGEPHRKGLNDVTAAPSP